jgi:type III pantothenate kinase
MIIAIDAGNSRIKWGVNDGNAWLDSGVLATADVAWLSEAADEWPANARCASAMSPARRLPKAFRRCWHRAMRDFVPPRTASPPAVCATTYERRQQLGADRWAALIGARGMLAGRVPGRLRRHGDDRRPARRRPACFAAG